MNFEVTKQEMEIIERIVDRAIKMSNKYDIDYSRMTATMDICATHANGCKLDLDALATSDHSNFCHDIFGIRRHMNRKTGHLENCFVPRFAKHEVPA